MRDDPLRKSRRGRRVAVAEHEVPEVEAPPNDPTTGLNPRQVGWRGRRRRYGLGSPSTSPASSRPPDRTEVARRCETRLLAATADTLEPRLYAQTRMNRPPPHVHGKEDVCHRLPPVADAPLCEGGSICRRRGGSLRQPLARHSHCCTIVEDLILARARQTNRCAENRCAEEVSRTRLRRAAKHTSTLRPEGDR